MLRRAIALLLVGTLLLSTPARGLAQETDDRIALQDATGGIWGVASLEVAMALVGAIVASQEPRGERGPWCTGACVPLILGVTLGGPIAVAIATQSLGTPADVPFVLHTAVWGGVTGFLVGAGAARSVFGAENAAVGAIVGTVLGLGLVGTYTFLRRDELVRDPDLVVAGHVLMWVPFGVVLGFGALILGIQAMNPNPERAFGAMLILGLVGAALFGGAIALAEGLHANDDTSGTTAPLGAWTTSF